MPLAEQLVHQRYVHSGPLVLGTAPLNFPTPTADRDRTVSRRSEPSSRATFIGEQPNPWDPLQPQDVTSRHRIIPMLSNGVRLYLHLVTDLSCIEPIGDSRNIVSLEFTRGGVLRGSYRLAVSISRLSFQISRYRVIELVEKHIQIPLIASITRSMFRLL